MIRIALPWLPPSSNNAYANRRGGHGRVLTEQGKKFLIETKAYLAQHYPRELKIFTANTPYFVAIRFFFEDIENKGFATGKATSRYKVFDGGNRTKLLEDALKDVGDVDDSQTLVSLWQKEKGTPERTLLWVWAPEQESTPFDELLLNLR